MNNESIAIVGAACHYPDARDPTQLWENILAGRRAFRRLPDCRLRLADYFSDDPQQPDTTYAAQAALLTDYEFDRSRFRVVGSTFRSADMAHWLALDVASRAFADAGFPDGQGLPKDEVGVLVGNSLTGEFSRAGNMRLRWPYVRRTVDAALVDQGWGPQERGAFLNSLEAQYKAPFPPVGDETLAGGLSNTIAGRICNHFDFRGGGYTVDGACASSLLAVANACSALSAGDLDIALAGGVDLSLDPFELVGFAKVGALAKSEMRVYDARSAGFWPGEGCGLVVLMRATDAVAQGRRIYAFIRGWGISSDGSGGITRPKVEGQKLALERAYRRAGFGADTVGYFEGHGTGTSVGDAVELETILSARQSSRHTPPCAVAANESAPELFANSSYGTRSVPATKAAIGSIKANIGHTKAAAGVAGLLKAALALQHQTLPPSVGWDQPHPLLNSDDASIELLRRAQPWPADLPLRAAVSAMGFGGINAHLVLEAVESQQPHIQTPQIEQLTSSIQDSELFLFTAETPEALSRQVERVASYTANLSFAELTDLAAALANSLGSGPVRAAVVASRPAELKRSFDLLLAWIEDGAQQNLDVDRGVFLATTDESPSIGYLFPGQGTTASLDGGAWSVRFPFVRQRYERADLPPSGNAVATEIAHPAIMTATLAGLEMCDRLGIESSVGVGHSLGELAAYHWAGVLDEPALLRLASARGQAIADHGRAGGAMAGIAAPADEVDQLIGDAAVVISGLNSPKQTIISGDSCAVLAVIERAHAAGLQAVRLVVSHAFHSPLVANAVEALLPALEREDFKPPQRLVASTITGGFLDGAENLRGLLRDQMTSPVRLMSAVEAADLKVGLWIEVGPGHVLRGVVGKFVDTPAVSLDAGGDSLRDLFRAAGAAFVLGAPLRVTSLFEDRFTRPFNLDWHAKFLVNPCELAPLPEQGLGAGDWGLGVGSAAANGVQDSANPQPPAPSPQPPAGRTPLEVVRQLVAERAELPLDAVQENDQLLQDLHFSSIAVGSVVADAARALGLPPPVSPTDYARATVGEVATALDELARTGAAAAATTEIAPAGVDTWVRSFTVELIEQSLPAQRAEPGAGDWQIVAPPDHAFAANLLATLNERVPHHGVVVCLPAEASDQHVSLLLDASRKVLEATGESRFIVVLHSNVGGGWARTLHLEMPHVTTCVVKVPVESAHAIDWIVAEAAAAHGFVEAHYDVEGTRRVPVLRLLSDSATAASPRLGPNDVLLVTGGGKGIAAECALDLARRYGVRLALLGRSTASASGTSHSPVPSPQSPAPDPQLDENLLRFSANGVTFRYISADVTDAAAVTAAVEEFGRTLGPVTALLHGAGGNVPQSLRTLDAASVRATIAPKIDGLQSVLSALDPQQLRLLVTFGSIIARTGLHGEADYAFANEWLTELTAAWHTEHPHCRCLAVEWSVWSGVGMGERLGRIDALRRQGITPIGPDEGVRILRQLISSRLGSPPHFGEGLGEGHPTAVVVSGRFGDPPTLGHEQPELPLLRFLEHPRLHVPGVELICDVALSLGADPYLRDHAYKDMPLLPAVMGLEAMAQVSMALTGAATPPNFEDVELTRPVTVPASENRTIRLAALVRAPGKVEVVLRSDETGFQADHFRAMCRFDAVATDHPSGGARSVAAATEPPATTAVSELLALNPRKDLYGRILFHRGRFQRIEGYRQLSATRCIAEVSPDGQARWFGGYLPETRMLGDPAMRDAAIHAIQACIPHGTILPVGIDRVFTARQPLAGPCVVHAEEREHSGDRFVYDLTISSTDGRFRERWEGLRLQRVDTAGPAAHWAEPLLPPYLERRLGELVPGERASVALTSRVPELCSVNGHDEENSIGAARDWHTKRQRASDIAIAAAAGEPITVLRRADGKPFVDDERAVSLAHASSFILSVASSRRLVACDAEPVVPRDAFRWNDLLLPERVALARLIAEQSTTEDFNAAATRMWSAGECLKKAGLRFDAPLVLRETTPDHWVVLTAGTTTIATWIGTVGDAGEPLAVALLVGSGDEVL